jgi:ParB-like chromosome segregation protein Spo0J
MLATKRYEYLPIDKIEIHHTLTNHRILDRAKVAHLEKDIVSNGLLEPLVVWERSNNEFYLVGGFHRMEAIHGIRKSHPGYFDRVDVRVVSGDPDEIKALNLKLNSDRVDTRITDYFQTVIYLNNANWTRERIAEFFDKSPGWIDDIVRFAPLLTESMREKLAGGELSWNRAREILQKTLRSPAGQEREIIDQELAQPRKPAIKPLPFRSTIKRLAKSIDAEPKKTFTVSNRDLYALVVALQGKNVDQEQLERAKSAFPLLWED